MSTKPVPISTFRKAWLRWKSLRLPWRKKFLVGLDLTGNTYWEFKDSLSSNRMRRIVEYNSAIHYSDVSSQITPSWHQWLRHTRYEPPSLQEQAQDVLRQENLKILAAQADARWAAKPRIGDPTPQQQPLPPFEVNSPGGLQRDSDQLQEEVVGGRGVSGRKETSNLAPEASPGEQAQTQTQDQTPASSDTGISDKENPWKRPRGGPSEDWQPHAWDPSATVTKRRQ